MKPTPLGGEEGEEGGFTSRRMVVSYQPFGITYRSRLDTWSWDQFIIPKRRYSTTILRCVKSNYERKSHGQCIRAASELMVIWTQNKIKSCCEIKSAGYTYFCLETNNSKFCGNRLSCFEIKRVHELTRCLLQAFTLCSLWNIIKKTKNSKKRIETRNDGRSRHQKSDMQHKIIG
jgi:hypothetical protein